MFHLYHFNTKCARWTNTNRHRPVWYGRFSISGYLSPWLHGWGTVFFSPLITQEVWRCAEPEEVCSCGTFTLIILPWRVRDEEREQRERKRRRRKHERQTLKRGHYGFTSTTHSPPSSSSAADVEIILYICVMLLIKSTNTQHQHNLQTLFKTSTRGRACASISDGCVTFRSAATGKIWAVKKGPCNIYSGQFWDLWASGDFWTVWSNFKSPHLPDYLTATPHLTFHFTFGWSHPLS